MYAANNTSLKIIEPSVSKTDITVFWPLMGWAVLSTFWEAVPKLYFGSNNYSSTGRNQDLFITVIVAIAMRIL